MKFKIIKKQTYTHVAEVEAENIVIASKVAMGEAVSIPVRRENGQEGLLTITANWEDLPVQDSTSVTSIDN